MTAGWVPGDFDDAYEALMPRALAVAERILGEGPDAEDAACEALVRALADWSRIRRLPYRDGWVLRVAANVAVDAARRRLVRLRPQPDLLPPVVDTEEITTQRLALAAELQALSRRQREVLVLRHMAGLSEADVATALGISTESAKTPQTRQGTTRSSPQNVSACGRDVVVCHPLSTARICTSGSCGTPRVSSGVVRPVDVPVRWRPVSPC